MCDPSAAPPGPFMGAFTFHSRPLLAAPRLRLRRRRTGPYAARMTMERTLVIVKPDGVQRGLVGPILARLEARGLKIVGLKLVS